MHNGAYPSLESVLSELIRLSALARAGGVRSADEGLSKIRIAEADTAPLVDFLNSLNEDLKSVGRLLRTLVCAVFTYRSSLGAASYFAASDIPISRSLLMDATWAALFAAAHFAINQRFASVEVVIATNI